MSVKGTIHVFLGAPSIAQALPQETCTNPAAVIRSQHKEWGFFQKGQHVSLQSHSNPQGVTVCMSEPVSTPNHCTPAPLSKDLEMTVLEKNQDSNADISSYCTTSTEMECHALFAATHAQNTEACEMRRVDKNTCWMITQLNDKPENTSCKRKTINSPSRDQTSKKSKHTSSSVKCVSKLTNQIAHTTFTPLTLLKHCSDKHKRYNILAVVLQPCHVKEILVKSGQNVGCSSPLAAIVVLDQSGTQCKVHMWRTNAFCGLALFPGDVIMVTNLTVCKDNWNKETFLQSTFNSRLLNLGNFFVLSADEHSNNVEYFVLQELLNYIFAKHCYLKDLPSQPPQKLDSLQHAKLLQLQPEVLVHSVVKVISISILKECIYSFKGLQQTKVILTVEDVKGQIGTIILCGTNVTWYERICFKKNHVWVFKYLFCKKSLISGAVELHTTPWSSCECLFADDKRAMAFQRRYYENISPPQLRSPTTITKGRYSDDIQIIVSISELEFHIPGSSSISITKEMSVTQIMSFLLSAIYPGCEKCRKELKMDSNHVYEQCFICLPFNKVRLFYRPALMTVRSKGDEICVHVSSDVLEKIFLNISPNLINKIVPGSTNLTYGAVVADTCCSLLADNGKSYLLTIKSHFLFDENSVPLEQEFHALAFLVHI
ncbi:shieldin complex subunit 2 [Pyxicephalus adspersus]